MRDSGERGVGMRESSQNHGALDYVAGHQITQHGRLAGAGRAVDPQKRLVDPDVVHRLVDREVLTAGQRLVRAREPSAQRQTIYGGPLTTDSGC